MFRPRKKVYVALPLLIICPIACQSGGVRGGPMPQTTEQVASAALAHPVCTSNTCADDTTLLSCSGGEVSRASCGDKAICVAGGCASLSTQSGDLLEKKRVRTLGAEGWVNAWSRVTPLPKKLAEAYLASGDPAPLGGAKAFHALCAPDGYVEPRSTPADKGMGQVVSIASTWILSPSARKVDLAVGVSGKITVSVGGNVVLEQPEAKGIGKRAFPDERVVSIDLSEGATRLSVMLEAPTSPDRTGGFYLRLRSPDGGVATGLGVEEPFADAACTTGELADLAAKLDIDGEGPVVEWHPAFRGLQPTAAQLSALGFEIAGGKDATKIGVPLAKAGDPIRLDAVGLGDVTVVETATDKETRVADHPLFEQRLPAYGDLVVRVAKLVSGIDRVKNAAIPEGSRASYEAHARSLARLVSQGDDDLPFLGRHTRLAETLLAAAEAGKDPYDGLTGVVYRAYRSPLDGTLQPFVAFVPPSQKQGKPQPLVVISHGRNRLPEHALRTLVGEGPDDHMTLRFAARNWPMFMDQHAVLVAPLGYDEGGAHPLGEEDVLDVIHDVEGAYHIDPSRVSLTGYSLGGTVAFVLPLHYPDVFAAAAPLCGYPNLMSYQSVYTDKDKAPWEDTILAKKYIVNYAENGLHIPLDIVHGGKDSPERSQVVVDKYKALGYSYIFDVQDDLEHNVWDYAYKDSQMVPWLTGKKRPASPKHVRLVTGEYRYDRAYWLRLLGMKDSRGSERASIDAKFDEKAKKITITTSNVDAFLIDRATLEQKDASGAAIAIDVDGETLTAPEGSGPLYCVHDANWSVTDKEPSLSGMKQNGVSGPIGDILHHPIVVVYGTKVPAHALANRLVAEELASTGAGPDVEYLVTAKYPVLSDTDATDDALRDKSVILIGSPSENAVTEKYASHLPITFDNGAIVAGGKRYEGKGVGVSFIAPRPDDPKEYVVVHAGLDVDGTFAARSLPRYLPDWVVYDTRVNVERGGLLFDQRPYLAGGFFDEHWR